MRTALTLPFFALILAACGAFPTPQTVDQRLAYAAGMNTAVVNAATEALEAGHITSDEAENALALSDRVHQLVGYARTANELGDVATAEAQLALAINVLTELQNHLNRRTP